MSMAYSRPAIQSLRYFTRVGSSMRENWRGSTAKGRTALIAAVSSATVKRRGGPSEKEHPANNVHVTSALIVFPLTQLPHAAHRTPPKLPVKDCGNVAASC